MILFIGNVPNRQTHVDRKQISGFQGLRGRRKGGGVTASGVRVSFGMMKMFSS
jgi:hypothetical protein